MATAGVRVCPRKEVAQLVLPAVFGGTRALSPAALQEMARKLSQQDTLMFATWTALAKELFKLSEGAAKLVWNLACAASLCTLSGAFNPPSADAVNVKTMLLFLALHLPSAPTRPSSPTANYDAVWPSAAEEKIPPLLLPMSAVSSSPLSPTKASQSSHFRGSTPQSSPSASPKSPRSPRSPSTPRSPRSPTTPRSPKAGSRVGVRSAHPAMQGHHQQTCNSIRYKLPVLLRLLSSDPDARKSHLRFGDPCENFFVTAADINVLQLILHASIGQSDATISEVFAHWSGNQHQGRTAATTTSTSSSPLLSSTAVSALTNEQHLDAGTVLTWLQTVITADDLASPLLPQHTVSRHEIAAQPELGTLFSTQPAPSHHHQRQASYKQYTMASLCLNRHIHFTSGNRTAIHRIVDNADDGGDTPTQTPALLPFVQMSNCSRSHVYLLGPYSYCFINGCTDSEINLGAVRGTVIVANCEGLRLTVACARLVIRNCLDCAFYPAVLTAPLIIGDCRGLRFGPHDMVYSSLQNHLALAGLPTDWTGINRWHDVVEVENYLDKSVNTPIVTSQPSADLNATTSTTEAVVNIIAPQHYVVRAVPVVDEAVRGEIGPIPPEGAYGNALRSRAGILGLLQARIQEKGITSVDWGALEAGLSEGFSEWLASTGRIQQVLDLVQLDSQQARREQDHETIPL